MSAPRPEPPSLADALIAKHPALAHAAVTEAGEAIRYITGLRGIAAQIGFDTINRLRPGFLVRHVAALMPSLAAALEPHWQLAWSAGETGAYLERHAFAVADSLLSVTDDYVARADDHIAIAVYHRLRPRAPARIAEQMPRIVAFVERHVHTPATPAIANPAERNC